LSRLVINRAAEEMHQNATKAALAQCQRAAANPLRAKGFAKWSRREELLPPPGAARGRATE